MASVQYLFGISDSIQDEFKGIQMILSKLTRLREYAAITIEKTWRGYRERKRYRDILKKIITIQSYCRGWLVRKRRAQYILEHEKDMEALNLNRAATIIQAAWRGYWIRKYMKGKLPRDLIEQRKAMQRAAEQMQETIRTRFAENKKLDKQEREKHIKKLIMYIVFKTHHLIRTYHIQGVYSNRDTTELSIIEKLMKALNMKDYMVELRKVYKRMLKGEIKETVYLFKNKTLRRFEDLYRVRMHELDIKSIDKNIYKLFGERFDLDGRIKRETYQRKITSFGPYTSRVDCVTHNDEIKPLNVSEADFVLNEKMDLKDRGLIYHPDYWETHPCHLHYPADMDERTCS